MSLLQAKTPFVTFEVRGPFRSHLATPQPAKKGMARLSGKSTKQPLQLTWSDSDGVSHVWPNEEGGPMFFEDTDYRLWVKSQIPGQVPMLIHREPTLLQKVDAYPEDLVCAGPFNFRRQVGMSTFEVRVGNDTLSVTIEIFPAKLDYDQDYRALLSEVASAARGLALEYLRATYRSGLGIETEEATNLEWLTLLRNEVESLKQSVSYINDHPHRTLLRQPQATRLEKVRRADSSVRRAIRNRRGQGRWLELPGFGRVRSSIAATQSRETLDAPENRWISFNLVLIRQRLEEIHSYVVTEKEHLARLHRPISKRLEAEERELAEFIGVIKRLHALPAFADIQSPPPADFSSLTLLGGDGYGEAYRTILVLRLGLGVEGSQFELSVMDLHDLYETWCFIQIVKQVTSLTVGQPNIASLLYVEESGIRVRLRRGRSSAIRFSGADGRTVEVFYNPEYPGLTGEQRPDIVLIVHHVGWPELIVVFDAKYRLDASESYFARFDSWGPPQDAINALHRYRDAITVESAESGLQRPVVKGAALFPLAAQGSVNFTSSRLFHALEVLGIGALPFLPDNVDLVRNWLKSLLDLPPDILAEPGPSFIGIAEKQRRQSLRTEGHVSGE